MTTNRNDINNRMYVAPEFVLVKLNNVDVITGSWELPEMPLPGGSGGSGGSGGNSDWELPEIPFPTSGN